SVCGVSSRIHVYSEVTRRNNEEETSTGTGIILTADGYIVTNNHIIEGAEKVYVTCEGVEYEADIIGTDATVDLAVLKAKNASNLKPAALGDSSTLRIGDTAVAIGDPLGTLKLTCTNGIISGLDREINNDGKVQNYIQTNAAVNPGNSGGPLLNEKGEVIGVVTMKTIVAGYDDYGNAIAAEGLGYAIPINDALPVIRQLIQYGYVPHPAIGIQGYEVTQFLSEELQVPQGVYVSVVYADGPAYAAGMMVDDVIVGVEGKTITTFAELSQAIKSRNVGDVLKLSIWRAGEVKEVELIIGDMNNMGKTVSQPAG
ncbi:MAG: S1C family serine protease, partial [Christensenellales bacterium]